MEKRVILAIVLSLLVIIVFHFIYVKYFGINEPIKQRDYNTEKFQKSQFSSKPPALEKENLQKKLLEKFSLYSVVTDDYSANITSSGVRFFNFKLKKYFYDLKKTKPIEIVSAPSEGLPIEIYLQSNPNIAVLNYKGPAKKVYQLEKENKKELKFELRLKNLLIEKTLIFKKDTYFIDGNIQIKNIGKTVIKDSLLFRGVFKPFAEEVPYTFKGPYYYTDHLIEVKLKDKIKEYVGPIKYVGYQDTYFIVALIPQKKNIENYKVIFRKLDSKVNEFILWTPEFTIKPGETYNFPFKLYIGPKKTEDMEVEYPLLAKALYFGVFDIIAKPLLYILKFFYNYTHNFGWAIVILTIILRIIFFPLNHISYKSMAKLKEVQPILEKIRKKYKDDPQRLQQEMMNIYKTYKVNPFTGCLPILIQIPVFIAFYKLLLQAIELRHAPFILWINDLSAPERLYIGINIPILGGIPLLTILMGLSMYLQQKLTPTTPDGFQKYLNIFMPIFFVVIFINFPSGLVLYWFVNNILSIIQQYITIKVMKN